MIKVNQTSVICATAVIVLLAGAALLVGRYSDVLLAPGEPGSSVVSVYVGDLDKHSAVESVNVVLGGTVAEVWEGGFKLEAVGNADTVTLFVDEETRFFIIPLPPDFKILAEHALLIDKFYETGDLKIGQSIRANTSVREDGSLLVTRITPDSSSDF